MILEPDELAELQNDMAEVMAETAPDRLDVLRGTTRTRSAASPDEFTESPNVIYRDVPCKYRASSGRDRFVANAPDSLELFSVTIPAKFRLETKDRLRIAAKGGFPEMILDVVTVMLKSNALTVKVLCSR